MSYPLATSNCYEHAKLVVKHTFLEFQHVDVEVFPKLKRNKSDSWLPGAVQKECPADACTEASTPTTCSSVNGDDSDDVQSLPSSRMTAEEIEEDGRQDRIYDFRWSLSSSAVNELLHMPGTPLEQAISCSRTKAVLPEGIESWSLLSTSALSPVSHSNYRDHGRLVMQNTSSDNVHDGRTTLMVRNLPTGLSQQEFVQYFIDAGYGGLFDFVYMPMNFRACGNFGYAFMNFTSSSVAAHIMAHLGASEYHDSENPDRWTSQWSNCQGWNSNVERYRNSPLMHESVPLECKPAIYDSSCNQVAFPQPTKRIPKPRIHFIDKVAKEAKGKEHESRITSMESESRIVQITDNGSAVRSHVSAPSRATFR